MMDACDAKLHSEGHHKVSGYTQGNIPAKGETVVITHLPCASCNFSQAHAAESSSSFILSLSKDSFSFSVVGVNSAWPRVYPATSLETIQVSIGTFSLPVYMGTKTYIEVLANARIAPTSIRIRNALRASAMSSAQSFMKRVARIWTDFCASVVTSPAVFAMLILC